MSDTSSDDPSNPNNDLPRPYLGDPAMMIDAYGRFQPERYRYGYRTAIKRPLLKQGELKVDGFTIPYQLRGKADAPLLAIDLPGGPGSAQNSTWKEKFDPALYRVIVADWRGIGTSTPLGRTELNTTDRLVEDIEALRLACARTPDEKLMLRGGSWGMTMAIAYAAKYPENVSAMALRLPFLARQSDLEWNYGQDGLSKRYPDAYRDFTAFANGATSIPSIMESYEAALNSDDQNLQKAAYIAFTNWENSRNGETVEIKIGENENIDQRIARTKVMTAYARNGFFLPTDGITPLLEKIPASVPVIAICHSRDPLCAADSLPTLMKTLPQADYMVKDADYHWISSEAIDPSRGFDNSFIDKAYPFACTRLGLLLTNKFGLAPLARPAYAPDAPKDEPRP